MKGNINQTSVVKKSLMFLGVTSLAIALNPALVQAEERQTAIAAAPTASGLVLQQKLETAEVKETETTQIASTNGAIAFGDLNVSATDLMAQTPTVPDPTVPTTPGVTDPTLPAAPTVEATPPTLETTPPTVPTVETTPPTTDLSTPLNPGTEPAPSLELTPAPEPSVSEPIPSGQPALLETGTATRFRLGYFGAGINAGITGEPAFGDTGFTVFSKIPLSFNLSLRPSIVFSDDVGIGLPLTYDFQIGGGDGEIPRFIPYLGGGLALNIGDDTDVDLLLTAGIDVPLSRQWTLTAGANVSVFDSFDLGLVFGFAYNFQADNVETRVITGVNPAVTEALREPRVNPSFLGVGANLGITGDSALGDSSFAVLSKIAIGPDLSLRPSALFEDDVTFLIPVAYDFPRITTDFVTLAPFLGAGFSFSTGDNSEFDLVLTGGFDVPITRDLAVTTGISITPFDSFDLGLQLGVVFTFGSF